MPQLVPILQPKGSDSPRFSDDEVRAMQRAVIKLFAHWGLSDDEAAVLLGRISVRTWQRWKAGSAGDTSPDLAARLSNLIGIHKALRLLFKDAARGYGWIKRPNEDFGGVSALDIMMLGNLTDLMRVRRYLDAQRGTW